MPRRRRDTNIQLLNAAFKDAVKISEPYDTSPTKIPDDKMNGDGASRQVKLKKSIARAKKIKEEPINTRILLTR